MDSKKTFPEWAKTISLMVLGILLACGAGEILVRVGTADQKNYAIEMWRYAKLLKQRSADPAIGHENVPGHSAILQGVEISFNSLGMRGPEPQPAASVHKRILIMGDSVALGWGVPEKNTVRNQLERMLGPGVEVLNGGVGNMVLTQIVALGARQLRSTHVDTVILLCTARAPELKPSEDASWLVRHSELAALLVIFARQISSGAAGKERLVEAYRREWTSGPGMTAMVSALDRLAALQRELGFKVVVAMMPDANDFNDYRFGFMTEVMARESAARKWPFVDLLPVLQGRPSGHYWVSPDDIHPNAEANHLIAKRLLPLVQQ